VRLAVNKTCLIRGDLHCRHLQLNAKLEYNHVAHQCLWLASSCF
jgi:hypothetical protein